MQIYHVNIILAVNIVDDTKLNIVVYMNFIHQDDIESSLNRWKQQNVTVTREYCRKLLIELKKQHLDQALTRLRGPDGCKVTFLEIKECYTAIENDFKAGAKGAEDICSKMFFEFHGVREQQM